MLTPFLIGVVSAQNVYLPPENSSFHGLQPLDFAFSTQPSAVDQNRKHQGLKAVTYTIRDIVIADRGRHWAYHNFLEVDWNRLSAAFALALQLPRVRVLCNFYVDTVLLNSLISTNIPDVGLEVGYIRGSEEERWWPSDRIRPWYSDYFVSPLNDTGVVRAHVGRSPGSRNNRVWCEKCLEKLVLERSQPMRMDVELSRAQILDARKLLLVMYSCYIC